MECPKNVRNWEDQSNVCGIGKTHCNQAGRERLDSGKMLVYSSHEVEIASHAQGVALMLSKEA